MKDRRSARSNRGLQETELVTGIVVRAFKSKRVNRAVLRRVLAGVSQLDFAPDPGCGLPAP
jgi:hypothetical protein